MGGVCINETVSQSVIPFRQPSQIVAVTRSLSATTCRLTELQVGATARLHDAQVDADSRSQLRALGLTDNALLRVCKQGDPCVVQVHATRVGISRRVAQQILMSCEAD